MSNEEPEWFIIRCLTYVRGVGSVWSDLRFNGSLDSSFDCWL